MGKNSFLTATDASSVTFDFDQGKSWQVTLGGNRTAVFAGGQDGDVVTILVTQDSTGSRTLAFPATVRWNADVAPSLKSTAGDIDAFTFQKVGSTWREISGGSPARLPTKLKLAALATIIVVGVGGGMVGNRLNLTQGNGQGIGNLPSALEARSKSGAELLTAIDGSGSVLVGSGILAVGSIKTNGSDAPFRVLNNGATTIKNTASASALIVGGCRAGKVCCTQTGGTLSYCQAAPDANGCACK